RSCFNSASESPAAIAIFGGHLLDRLETHTEVKPIEYPLRWLSCRRTHKVAQPVTSVRQHPHLGLWCPAVGFQRRFQELLRKAQAVLGYPGKIATQLALTRHTACHHLIFSQPHRSIRSNIGSVNGNAESFRRGNRFAPGLRPIVLARLDDSLL